jgi:hypothetical protein
MRLNPKQLNAVSSRAREIFFVAGLGAGKTYTAVSWLLPAFHPDYVKERLYFGVFAPTYNVVNKVTLKAITDVLASCGYLPDVHYVVNKRPPENWGIEPFSTTDNRNILTTFTGNYVYISGLHEFDRALRGHQFDRVFVDEYRDCKKGVRDVLLGRMRGEAFKRLGLKHQILYATTPPSDPSELRELQYSSDGINIDYITATTLDNKANLPAGYIDNMKSRFSELMYKREVLGELVDIADNAFCYAFDAEKHVKSCEFDPKEPVYISFDFNVNPMTAIVAQHIYGSHINILEEYRQENSNVERLANTIFNKYKGCRIYITGDASGDNRSSIAAIGTTAYTQIASVMGLSVRTNFHVPRENPRLEHSSLVINSLFDKFTSLNIDHKCKFLIEDLKYVQMDKTGTRIDKSDIKRGHLLDCLRYYLHTYHEKWVTNVRLR